MKIQEYVKSALDVWKNSGKVIELTVDGQSMMPLIKFSDRISIRFVDPEEIRRGDVFAFLRDKSVVIHRFIKKRRRENVWWFCEKGDNCMNETWINERAFLGKVEMVYSGKSTLNMLKWPWVMINPVLGFCMLIWITAYGKLASLTKLICGPNINSVLFKLKKRLAKLVNCIFIVVKLVFI